MKNIKEVFYKNVPLKITNSWVDLLNQYMNSLFTKNENHVKFFGSVLVGVYPVTYDAGDTNYFWDILLEADREVVKEDLHKLKTVDSKWNIGGNVTNHAILYLIHLVQVSSLSDKLKEHTITNLLILIQFKFLTSLFKRDYPYPVNPEVALNVYNRLSKRYILRQVDSWKEYMVLRANDIYSSKNQRKDLLSIVKSYSDDKLIVNTITGIRWNLNGMMVDYNRVFHATRDDEDSIKLDTKLGSNESGESIFKDNTGNIGKYKVLFDSMVKTENTFISDNLLGAIVKASNGRYAPCRKVLAYISENFGERRQDDIEEFTTAVLTYGLSRLHEERRELRDVQGVLTVLNGLFSSSRSLDPMLLSIKDLGEGIITRRLENKASSNTRLIRTIVCSYLIIRVITDK